MRRLLLFALVAMTLAGSPPGRPNRVRVAIRTGQSTEAKPSFRVKLDGEPAAVLATKGPADDLMLILVLDLTGDFERAELARTAAIESIAALRPNTTVAVMRAQDGMQVLVDPTTDRARIEAAIRDLPISGKAGFLDTVEPTLRVADRVLSKSQVRAAVIYLTDSSIYNHRADYANPVINASDSHDMSRRFPEGIIKQKISNLESKIAALQAPLFVVQLAYRTDRLEQAYQTGQLQLTGATGGAAQFCRSNVEVSEAVANAFREAAAHYTAEIRLPERGGRTIQIQVENGGEAVTHRSRFSLPE